MVKSARKAASSKDSQVDSVISSFEPLFFNNMVLVLDNSFCHRQRTMELKDGNPPNEVRVLCNSISENNGIMAPDKTIKLNPAKLVRGCSLRTGGVWRVEGGFGVGGAGAGGGAP